MILTHDHLDDLLDLFIRANTVTAYTHLERQDQINSFFVENTTFGTYSDGRLVSTCRLTLTKSPNLIIASHWMSDRTFPNMEIKFQCFKELQEYAIRNNCRILRVTKTHIMKTLYKYSRTHNIKMKEYQVIKIIPPGTFSGIAWIDKLYFKNKLPTDEWVIMLSYPGSD